MAHFEDKFVNRYPKQPLLWKRYVDDVICIWQHGEEELLKFCDFLNSCHDRIKFTLSYSKTSVDFLDTTLRCDTDGNLSTTLYCKPNDSHTYLQYNSAHPESVKRGLPYSEFLRVRRACTDDSDFHINSAMLAAHFIRRGYPLEILDEAFDKVKLIPRATLLNPDTDEQGQGTVSQLLDNDSSNATKPKVFSITTFNPAGNPNHSLIQCNWPLLGMSNTTQHLYQHQVVHGYRRPPNLRDKLVHSRLKITREPTQGTTGREEIDKTCRHAACRYCPRLNLSGFIISPATGKKYKCCKNITCHSSNLIYCIKCTHCNLLYVGQTKRELKKRLVEHFSYITKPDLMQPLGKHFNTANHPGIDAVEVSVLKFISAGPNTPQGKKMRDESELSWIHRLRTALPHGLNSMD